MNEFTIAVLVLAIATTLYNLWEMLIRHKQKKRSQ